MEENIDILLATYNGEKYIKEQIESILNQTYKNINLIISDDCSTDNTRKHNRRTISSKIRKTRQHHNKKNPQNKSNKQRRKRKHKKCNNNGRNVQTRNQRRNKPHNAMPKITIKNKQKSKFKNNRNP